jgi:hypothetical protein
MSQNAAQTPDLSKHTPMMAHYHRKTFLVL